MIRVQQTVEILNAKLKCDIKTINDLRERNKNGTLSGMTKEEAKRKYPDLVEELKDYRNQIRGAESQEGFEVRIRKAFWETTNTAKCPTIGIVTHGMPFWVIFNEILNNNRIIHLADCAYAVLSKEDQQFTLERSDGIEYKKD